MKHTRMAFAALMIGGGVLLSGLASAQQGKPWALRDFYNLQFGPMGFAYDVQTSDWQIEIDGAGFLFENVHAEVILGDGTTVRMAGQGLDRDEREPFEDNLGKGTAFRSVFKPASGIAVRYSMKQYSNRAFILLQMEVRNESGAPIEIAQIRPAVMGPGSITEFAKSVHVEPLYVSERGGLPHLNDTGGASLLQFAATTPQASIGLGILPSGTCDSAIVLDRSSDQWTATVGVTYSPPIVLAPGDSVRADPLWIGFLQKDISYIRDTYSWCRSVGPSVRRAWEAPPTWVTIAPNEPIAKLYDSAKSWRQYNIRAALVPGSWEQTPGSRKPKVPQFPSDLREIVSTLQDAGVSAGLSCDPLAAGNSKSPSALTAKDGSRWFLPKSPEVAGDAVSHASTLTELGFTFFVVEPSSIPDDVLRQAKLTRAEADTIAFHVMSAAAGQKPVLPSSAMTLRDELPRWQLAAQSTTGYPGLGIVPGPIRLDAANISQVTGLLLVAIDGYLGPIEILGVPDSKLQKEIGPALGDPEWRRQLDAYRNPNLRVQSED